MRRGFKIWYLSYGVFGFLVPGLSSILLPLLIVDAGHRPFRVGAVVAAQNWGILSAPLWGWFADRRNAHRSTLLLGLLCLGLGFATFGEARGLLVLLSASLLIGLGTGACSTVANLLVVEFSSASDWSGGISQLQLCGACGTLIGFGVAGRLPTANLAAGAAALVLPAALLAVCFVPRRAPGMPRPALQPMAMLRNADFKGLSPQAGWGSRLALFLLTWSLFSLAVSAFSSLYPIMMLRAFGIHLRMSVDAIAMATLLSLPLYVVSGRLVCRCGTVRIIVVGIMCRVMALGALAALIALHRTAVPPVLLLVGAFQMVWPLIGVASNELAAVLAPQSEGLAIGLFNAAGAFSSGLGAMLSGLIAQVSGYRSVSAWAAAIALIALACSFLLARDKAIRGNH